MKPEPPDPTGYPFPPQNPPPVPCFVPEKEPEHDPLKDEPEEDDL